MTDELDKNDQQPAEPEEMNPAQHEAPSPHPPMEEGSLEQPPVPSHDQPAPATQSAQLKMADEMKSGGTPFNYRGELGQNGMINTSGSNGAGSFLVILSLLLALLITGIVAFKGWNELSTVSDKIDRVNHSVERLAEKLNRKINLNEETGRAVARSELQKSLKALGEILDLDDPETTRKAIELQGKIMDLLALIGVKEFVITKKPGNNDEATGGMGDKSTIAEPDQPANLSGKEPSDAPEPASGDQEL